jgi:hypothetical protein
MIFIGYLVAAILVALGVGILASGWTTLHQTDVLDQKNLLLLIQVAMAFVGAIAAAILTATLEKVRKDAIPDNQTRDEWLEPPIVANDPNAMGTGVVLRQARGTKDYVLHISYDDMLAKGAKEQFFAFAWVPHGIATFQQIQQTPCSGRCSKTCKRPGCLCDRSVGHCK